MKNMIRIQKIELLLILVGVIIVYSGFNNPLNAQLSLSVSYAPVEQLSVADVDFERFESKILLFTLSIKNGGTVPDTAKLQITVNIKLVSGQQYVPAFIFVGKDAMVFQPGVKMLTNLNQELGKFSSEVTTNKNDVRTNVVDVALATGKFPAGKYSYRFALLNQHTNGIITEAPPVDLYLENITRVELRSPRDGETTNEFPLFEFFQEGNKAELLVAEKAPDQSKEDAIAKVPPMNKIELSGQNSFLYSGGRPLEQGKTYVWKVTGKTTGSGGIENQVPSPVWEFTVGQTVHGTASVEDAILKILEETFGNRYQNIFEQIKQGGFAITGSYGLDGSTMTQSELLKILNELRNISDDVDLSFE